MAVFPDAELARNGAVRARRQRADARRAAARALPGAVEDRPRRNAPRPRQPAAARRRRCAVADGAAADALPRRLPLLRARPRRRDVEAAREQRQPGDARRRRFSRARDRVVGRSANERDGTQPWTDQPSRIRSPIVDDQTRTFIKPSRAGEAPAAARSAPTTAAARRARRAGGAAVARHDDERQPQSAGRRRQPLLAARAARARDRAPVADPAGAARCRSPRASAISRRARARRASRHERVMAGRYVLCTMIDEAAADTPWGGSGVWSRHSLLAHVPQRDRGRREGVPADGAAGREAAEANRDLLELIYVRARRSASRAATASSTTAARSSTRCATGSRRSCGRSAATIRTRSPQHWQGQRGQAQRRRSSWLPLVAAAARSLLLLVGIVPGPVVVARQRAPIRCSAHIQGLRLTPPVGRRAAAGAQAAPRAVPAARHQGGPGRESATRSTAASSRSAATAPSRPAARRCCPSAKR